MSTTPIWGALAPETAHQIFLCAQETQKKLYKSAVEGLAKHMGLRPNRVLEMPKVERHAAWQKLLTHPQLEPLSFNFLCHWLLTTQGPLLSAWLDALGIPHDGGGVVEDFPPAPSQAALKKAVDAVLAKFDPKLVTVYLRTFNEIEGVHWDDLDALIAEDPRLKLEA
jgi:hypothetical protein